MEPVDDGDDGDGTKRQVNVEAPTPINVVGEDTTEERAENGGEREDRAEQALVLATFANRNDITEIQNMEDNTELEIHTRAANAGNCTAHDEHYHAVGNTAKKRSEKEDKDGKQHHWLEYKFNRISHLTSKDVGEFAIQRLEGRGCQQICGTDPSDIVQRVET
ncbi:hypothetical protein BC937DRAFT_93647 [Endogone sp. FLAS-F59071]|nr:hypothetical protein BC937DRAFT_93647 [Endogone sp. FLAS-F59071]|eukprot:RUS14553.1 hypothetical protein BC937DRAFT_93647 [Endogone sp. FLAS-F59071]